MTTILDLVWRLGGKRPIHMYAMAGETPSDDDVEIAVALGCEEVAASVAQTIVNEHNRQLAGGEYA